ncbi:hypothetical protein L249_7516 [Ophiocordyceps polyrhachis-furcata BCC 54312]|uniref:Anaphase-promoting complex subunit 4 WD40 domain-containing protein n=1 Tax=Ophiocordyceps polyrhachis-furcata BCC 54312 TaxID=1330021 RepID=A0A367LB13_9HYPO|nr:hypothetical protein L249_7516 [Ophiocordyceps polyrhachis-furcata BCC 54312]
MATISPKTSLTLHLPPSCLQTCPFDPAYFVVGTYNLHQAAESEMAQSRDGSLVLFRIGDDDGITEAQTVPQPSAVLDVRFHPRQGDHQGILAAVSSTSTLAIFRLDSTRRLRQVATSRVRGMANDVLFLQCVWHPVLDHVIAVTDSRGAARLLHLDGGWNITACTDLDIGNSLEAWSIAMSPPLEMDDHDQAVIVYCGGDDCSLRHTLCSPDLQIPYAPVTIKGQHDAGVTAILPLPLHAADGGRLVVTGSYDDRMRVFAVDDLGRQHTVKRPRLVCDTNLEGGVWRLSLVDTQLRIDGLRRARILASCMHAGPKLVELTGEADGLRWVCKASARFDGHNSMNYASDCVVAEGGESLRCVSTSFYDKLLCLWVVGGGDDKADGVSSPS